MSEDLGRLLRNRARCKHCGDVVESRHVHEYVRCSCGAVAVDGGLEYAKRAGWEINYQELAVFEHTAEGQLRLDGTLVRYAAATPLRGYPEHGKVYRAAYAGEGAVNGSLYDLYDVATGDRVVRDEPCHRLERVREGK